MEVKILVCPPSYLQLELKDQPTEIIRFEEIPRKEIFPLRLKLTPYCIMSFCGKMYAAELPEYIGEASIVSLNQEHKCTNCDHCIALPTEENGCSKVFNRDIGAYAIPNPKKLKLELQKNNKEGLTPETKAQISKFLRYLHDSKRIEKYPYIKFGIEIINAEHSYLQVLICNRFKTPPYREPDKNFRRLYIPTPPTYWF